jgi:hypothetical protein
MKYATIVFCRVAAGIAQHPRTTMSPEKRKAMVDLWRKADATNDLETMRNLLEELRESTENRVFRADVAKAIESL